jgi:short-subunit dehydrogenase
MSENNSKVVLITGCSTGIGFETAIEFARNGFKTYASMRDLNKKLELENKIYNEKLPLEILQIDVTKQESINSAINIIKNQDDRIDVLINNAGYGMIGSIENLSLEEIKNQYETVVFGSIRMIKSIIPFMKKQNSGKIINISSVSGQMGFALSSAYVSSKFALEGLTDSLRQELSLYGISLSLIEPGIVKSQFHKNMKIVESSQNQQFKEMTIRLLKQLAVFYESGLEPNVVAKKILEVVNSETLKPRYVVGKDAEFLLENKKRMTDSDFEKFVQDTFKEVMEFTE